jgi:hypothetical protein
MTLPPPAPLDDEVTVTDAEDEVAFMLDCIAIETRIRTALRLERFGNQGFGADEDGGASSSELVPSESGEFVAGTMRPWGKYFPPSSC